MQSSWWAVFWFCSKCVKLSVTQKHRLVVSSAAELQSCQRMKETFDVIELASLNPVPL